jgi:hypothetical protein
MSTKRDKETIRLMKLNQMVSSLSVSDVFLRPKLTFRHAVYIGYEAETLLGSLICHERPLIYSVVAVVILLVEFTQKGYSEIAV